MSSCGQSYGKQHRCPKSTSHQRRKAREHQKRHRTPPKFSLCGPSDDPDEQTAVTSDYRHLLVQLQRLASPILPEAAAFQLNSLDIEINNLYSAFEAHAEIDALLPDI